jgi:hypothetical protein
MRLVRLIWFLLSIALGVAIGLAYGWLVKPAGYGGTRPGTLRADYKADYVLMVAEVYQKEGSEALAAHRLAELSSDAPIRIVQEAILSARQLEYSKRDMDTLAYLAEAMQNWAPAPAPAQAGSTP